MASGTGGGIPFYGSLCTPYCTELEGHTRYNLVARLVMYYLYFFINRFYTF